MRRYVISGAMALLCAGTIVMAQNPAPADQDAARPGQKPATVNPQDPAQSAPATQPPAATAQDRLTADRQSAIVTLVGCLQNERDVPGRKPNVVERAGVLEDYLLTDASMAPAAGRTPSDTTSGAVGTSGTSQAPPAGSTYKVEGIADDRLKQLVGKRVEVTGRIDEDDMREVRGTAGSGGTTLPGGVRVERQDAADTPEFEATSIREVAGSCAPQR
jgi:hypothetical protein